jgi:hypothetical protein
MATTSVQDMVRPGSIMDIYYYDADTNKKQAFATTQNTKYVQAFANTSGGSSVFTIPPNNGIQDIVCTFTTQQVSGVDASGLALPRGWGYALIKQVSFRYGGSSQYFLTGDQILQNALRKQTNRLSADDILVLGGNSTTDQENATTQIANVVLTLPHNVPSAVNKANPLPTDLLTQQVQVTIELNPLSAVYTASRAGAVIPSNLATAQFQVQQVMLNNQSDALARRVDMAENAYAFPCEFVQQVQRIPLGAGGQAFSSGSVVLTGFRSGEVKSIQCWLTRASDIAGTNPATAKNPFLWYPLTTIQMTYAGDVYARYENGSNQLFNLINGNKTPLVDNILLTSAGGAYTETPITSYWHELPFAQTLEGEGSMNTLVHGKPITNGIVNLDIVCPSSQTDWILNVSYIYNATLLFSSGTADYVF